MVSDIIKLISIRRDMTYSQVYEWQKREFETRVECRKKGMDLPGDVVFFVEHNPVYTLGRHGLFENLLLSEEALREENIEFARTDRGGDITYHGPGQLTVYPILDLLRYRLGVKDYVNLLEECVIKTISTFGIKGERIDGRTGVWIDKDKPDERKICAIGVRCSRHVSMHGFALNVGSDISRFSGINPCGLNKGVTSVSKEIGREINIETVAEILWENLTFLLLPRIPAQGNF